MGTTTVQIPAQISFKNMPPNADIEGRIQQRIGKLERFHDRITSCRVHVEAPQTKDFHGQVYHVRVDITVPGGEVVVNREPGKNHAHNDVGVAIRDAFDAAERRLEDFVRRHDPARVKPHAAKLTGKVARLDGEAACGVIIDAAGRELFFPRAALTVPWESIAVGTEVRFTEHDGDKGPTAAAVTPV